MYIFPHSIQSHVFPYFVSGCPHYHIGGYTRSTLTMILVHNFVVVSAGVGYVDAGGAIPLRRV
jgi:hypothetical protein